VVCCFSKREDTEAFAKRFGGEAVAIGQLAVKLLKPLSREREGNFDSAIRRSVNVEDKPRRGEFDQLHTEVSRIPVGLVRLDI
jgi:hypothetical protein